MDQVTWQGWLIVVTLLVFFLAAYFLPWLAACWRGHAHTGALFALNLLTGWTLVGWVTAFVWAFVGRTEKRRSHDLREMRKEELRP